MKVAITVALKTGVLDPEAAAIQAALVKSGHGVQSVVRSREFLVDMDIDDPEAAKKAATEMAETLLANTVIENYTIDIRE